MAGLQLCPWNHRSNVVSDRLLSTTGSVRAREVTLVDLLDRLLGGGVVIHGDITLAAADIDLVELDLRLLVASIDKALGS
jgi:gas vesicle protein GvpA/GvpJ/GvpM family